MMMRWLTVLGLLVTCILQIISTTQAWFRYYQIFSLPRPPYQQTAGPYYMSLFTIKQWHGSETSIVGSSCTVNAALLVNNQTTWDVFGSQDCHLYNSVRATATTGLVATCLVTILLLLTLVCRLKTKTSWMMGLMILGWLSNLTALSVFFRWPISVRTGADGFYYSVDFTFYSGFHIFCYVIVVQTISMCMLYATMRGLHQYSELQEELSQPQHTHPSRALPILTFVFLLIICVLDIVSFTRAWLDLAGWKFALFFATSGGTTKDISPTCSITTNSYLSTIFSDHDCQYFNGIRATALIGLLATCLVAIILLITLMAPHRMCRIKVKTNVIMFTMVFAWMNNIVALFVFIGWAGQTDYIYLEVFTFYPGFILFFVMTLLHTLCMFLLYPTTRILNSYQPVEGERESLQPGAQPQAQPKSQQYGAVSQPQFIPSQYYQIPPSPYYASPSPMLVPSGISLQPVPVAGGYFVPSSYPSYQPVPQPVQPVPVPGAYFVPSSPMQYQAYPTLYGAANYSVLQQPQPWSQAQPKPLPRQPEPEPEPEPESESESESKTKETADDPAPAYQPRDELLVESIPSPHAQRVQAEFDNEMLGAIAPLPWNEQEHEMYSS